MKRHWKSFTHINWCYFIWISGTETEHAYVFMWSDKRWKGSFERKVPNKEKSSQDRERCYFASCLIDEPIRCAVAN